MRFDQITKNESPNIRQRLAEVDKKLLEAFDQSREGMKENIERCRSWALKEIAKSRDGILTIILWTDEMGTRRSLHFRGAGGGPSYIPANARRFSNHRSQEKRIEKLQGVIAPCDRLLSHFAAGAAVPVNYLEVLDAALAAIPDEDALEEIEPKVKG